MTIISELLSWMLVAQTAEPQQSAWPSFVPIIGIVCIFYFVLIRPQQTEAQSRQKMREALKKGDDVVTGGGMYGQISDIDGAKVTLKVGQKADVVFIVFDKSAIERVLNKSGKAAAPADKSEASEAKK